MSAGKHVKRRVRILVKAFPQPSKKHEETVCCAGITVDNPELLRLFPIRYRRLDKDEQFDRFDLVEMTVTKAPADPRPESYRVDEGSIQRLERGARLRDSDKVKLWMPFIVSSLKELMSEQAESGRSLGIIKPDTGSVKFVIKEADKSDADDKEVADLVYEQVSFLEGPLKPLARPKYSFSYHYTSGGHRHKHQIHDWEVQAAFIHYKRRYGSEQAALDMMVQEYQERIPTRNLHFIMGNMAKRPSTFMVIGLLRSALDPQDLGRQGQLL